MSRANIIFFGLLISTSLEGFVEETNINYDEKFGYVEVNEFPAISDLEVQNFQNFPYEHVPEPT